MALRIKLRQTIPGPPTPLVTGTTSETDHDVTMELGEGVSAELCNDDGRELWDSYNGGPFLPISFGPDALVLRASDPIELSWMDLGRFMSQRDDVKMVTVHCMGPRGYGIQVDTDDNRIMSAQLFLELIMRVGTPVAT